MCSSIRWNDPKKLSLAAKFGQSYGYSKINLNIGCPSNRVQNGSFGACLMKTPKVVSECVRAMQDVSQLPLQLNVGLVLMIWMK